MSDIRHDITGMAQTVVGPVPPDSLGVTIMHEHLLIDMAVWFMEPAENSAKYLAYKPISLENLGWIRCHPSNNLDNMQILDEQLAIEESLRYKLAGGGTIVDVTTIGLGRDPMALARISRATGLNIIMGAGYYAGPSLPLGTDDKSEDELVDEIVKEIQKGIGDSGVRAGIIGEVGCMWPLEEIEKKMLRASARAQRITGAPLTIHPGRHEAASIEIIEFLDRAGADLQRTIICHVDRNVFDPNRRLHRAEECAEAGCWIEYDCFGWESYYPLGHAKQSGFDLPNDRQRIDDISKLIQKGYLDRILISHDICRKMSLCRYGGNGYAHILQNVLPRMRDHGITDSAINTIMVENPKRILTFVEGE